MFFSCEAFIVTRTKFAYLTRSDRDVFNGTMRFYYLWMILTILLTTFLKLPFILLIMCSVSFSNLFSIFFSILCGAFNDFFPILLIVFLTGSTPTFSLFFNSQGFTSEMSMQLQKGQQAVIMVVYLDSV